MQDHQQNQNQSSTQKKYVGDPSLRRPPSTEFQCRERIMTEDELQVGESDDYYEGYGSASTVVAFECTVANQRQQRQRPSRLLFACREPSCGVLAGTEAAAIKEDDGAVDPSFFDRGYTMAGRTGFQVWPGSRLMVEALAFPTSGDSNCQDPLALQKWQQALVRTTAAESSTRPLRILELGAGVGVVGASLAAASGGAHVLLTDLPTLVSESLQPNLERNATTQQDGDTCPPPAWLLSPEPTEPRDDASSSSAAPSGPVPIGNGWVATAALDWTKPVEQQLTPEQCQVDLVIACDCVWLVSMLDGLLQSVQSIFDASASASTGDDSAAATPTDTDGNTSKQPTLLMSFQRRDPADGNDSHMFTTVDRVIQEIHNRNWSLQCLAWQPVVYQEESDHDGRGEKDVSTTIKEVFLFEISPRKHQ